MFIRDVEKSYRISSCPEEELSKNVERNDIFSVIIKFDLILREIPPELRGAEIERIQKVMIKSAELYVKHKNEVLRDERRKGGSKK